MNGFSHWKKLHESEKLEEFSNNTIGLLWLKTKSVIRKEIVDEFTADNNIVLIGKSLNDKFTELFKLLAKKRRLSGSC